MGCCQVKDAGKNISINSNVNLDEVTKHELDNNNNKATLTMNLIFQKDTTVLVEEPSVAKEASSIKHGKKKKKNGKTFHNLDFNLSNFIQDIVNEINLARCNPIEYAEKIRSNLCFIKLEKDKDDKEKLIYHQDDTKVSLLKGEESFKKCIEILLKISPLEPLKISEDIVLEVPDDPDIQSKSFNKLQSQLKAQFPSNKIGCNLDLGPPNPEIIVLLQLVDDNKNNGLRRNNILDSNYKNLGVSIKKGIKKHYSIYLTFSD